MPSIDLFLVSSEGRRPNVRLLEGMRSTSIGELLSRATRLPLEQLLLSSASTDSPFDSSTVLKLLEEYLEAGQLQPMSRRCAPHACDRDQWAMWVVTQLLVSAIIRHALLCNQRNSMKRSAPCCPRPSCQIQIFELPPRPAGLRKCVTYSMRTSHRQRTLLGPPSPSSLRAMSRVRRRRRRRRRYSLRNHSHSSNRSRSSLTAQLQQWQGEIYEWPERLFRDQISLQEINVGIP